jgi:CheY-like chemotaxis protein
VNDAPPVDMSSVLLVEDELLVRELAYEDLGDAGFDVTAANDGDEALGLLREGRRFDLLFTDIRMPGTTDGWELAREAMQLLPDLRIIYATGLGDAASGLAANERYVRKPYSLSDLREALGELGFAEAGEG